ncbi:MAG: type IVB secretion system protein IcmH/DotU [Methylococcales bacterium]|nr:type IVB secretion system protein IcmH/DotU [Methylococcales bacterium]
MSQDDPFGNYLDEDKTVLKPSPGRRNQNTDTSSPTLTQNTRVDSPASYRQDSSAGTQQLNLHSDENVLLGCALPLLSLVNQLRNSASHADVSGLRNAIINEIKTFDTKARQSGCPVDQVQTARYALCSLLDEVVLNTPWGCNSIWSTQSMLITFHKESWGGEKFFQVLNNIISQPGTYFNLLELFYYCLSLGFEGKYKVQEQGQNKLYDVRENLYQVIQRHKGDYEQDLSLHWRGITDKRNVLSRYIPLWVVGAVAAAILTLIYIGFLYAINQSSGAEIGTQYQIKDTLNVKPEVVKKIQPASIPEVPLTPVIDKVRQFLAAEIAAKKVEVVDENGQSIIRILAKNFFASGSDKIQSKYLPLMQKINQALEVVTGQVTVVGHTDNIPIFTVRFPSNWVLSQARAQSVANILLANEHHQNRVLAEGRADTQSLVPNDSAKHRAMNRRVEITFKD